MIGFSLTGRQKIVGAGFGLALLPLLTIGSAQLPDEQDGVVAHWRLQNGVKHTTAAQNHLIVDSSGNDQHGMPIGNPRFERTPIPGSNLALGFSNQHQRVFIPEDKAFELGESLTLEAYVRVDRVPAHTHMSYIVFRGDNRPGFDPWWLGVRRSGQLAFAIVDAANESSVLSSPEPLPIGKWVHVAGVLDHEAQTQHLYVNGRQVAVTKTALRPMKVLRGPHPGIAIGNIQWHSPQHFHGAIAEVRISKRALLPRRLLPPIEQD